MKLFTMNEMVNRKPFTKKDRQAKKLRNKAAAKSRKRNRS